MGGSGSYIDAQQPMHLVGDRGRALDLRRLTANLAAPVVEHFVLMTVVARRPKAVPQVRVLCGELEGHLLAAAADQQRDHLAQWRGVQLPPALLDDRQRAAEVAE